MREENILFLNQDSGKASCISKASGNAMSVTNVKKIIIKELLQS